MFALLATRDQSTPSPSTARVHYSTTEHIRNLWPSGALYADTDERATRRAMEVVHV
jgi:hypothetical protein